MATFTPSSKRHPCKMCGRTKDGDCRELDSGIILCHTVLNGVDSGQQHPEHPFVYCGQTDEGPGAGKWKPLELCEDRTDKAPRKPATHYFDYTFWDGTPTPAQRYRKDVPGKPKEVKWCKGGLHGRPQTDVAPYRWQKEHPLLVIGDSLFIVKGELKADLLAGRGLHCISLLNKNDERLITELHALVVRGIDIVLAPDNDLADLESWYATITAAIPQVKSLLCPLKGMNWRNPPEDGGLGLEDWIARSRPSNDAILAAITDTPWQSPTALAVISSVDQANPEAMLLQQLGDGWHVTDKGHKVSTLLNAGSALTLLRKKLPDGCLRLNLVTGLIEVNGAPIEEADLATLYAEAQAHGWEITEKACSDALLRIARQHRFDPIQDYLNYVAAAPDITPADINVVATTYLGTTNPAFDLYMKIALLGAVRRRFEPGCQFDTVVTLDGDGRIGKSGVWMALATSDWHSSSDAESEKDFLLILHQTWIYEQAELDYLTSKKAVGQLKNLITTRKDSVRAPYGKGMEQRSRAGTMVGTVNGPFLQGDEALRGRFLVILCPQSFKAGQRIDVDRIAADRDRIWKAAVLAYRNGEATHLNPQQLAAASQSNLASSEHDHHWLQAVSKWLQQPVNTLGPHTSDDILIGAGLRSLDRITKADQMELSRAMEQIGGWAKDREPARESGRKARFWRRLSSLNSPENGRAGTEVGT